MFYSFSIIWPDRQERRGENSWILQRRGGPWTHRETLRMQNTWWAACRCSMYRYSPLFHIQTQNILRTYYSLITKVSLFVLQELGVSKTLRTFCDLSTPESEEDFFLFQSCDESLWFWFGSLWDCCVFSIKANRKYPLVTQKEETHTRDTLACRITPTDSTHTLTHTPNKGIPFKPHTHVVKFITRCLCVTFGFYPDPDVGK